MNSTSKNLIYGLLWLTFGISLLIGAPLVSIWAINTLFGLGIPYTLSTWFAALWVSAVTLSTRVFSK